MVVRVAEPKGYHRSRSPSNPREVGIDKKAREIIETWLEASATRPVVGSDWVFTTYTGERLQESYVRQLLPRLARRAGIDRRVHPHALRHTYARELYEEGVGLMEIMRALGHRSLSTTQTYLDSIGATKVIHITSRRSW